MGRGMFDVLLSNLNCIRLKFIAKSCTRNWMSNKILYGNSSGMASYQYSILVESNWFRQRFQQPYNNPSITAKSSRFVFCYVIWDTMFVHVYRTSRKDFVIRMVMEQCWSWYFLSIKCSFNEKVLPNKTYALLIARNLFIIYCYSSWTGHRSREYFRSKVFAKSFVYDDFREKIFSTTKWQFDICFEVFVTFFSTTTTTTPEYHTELELCCSFKLRFEILMKLKLIEIDLTHKMQIIETKW